MKGLGKWILKWAPWGVAFALGLVGAILAFALHPSEASGGPFNMQAVGGVLLAAGAVLAAALLIGAGLRASASSNNPGQAGTANVTNTNAEGQSTSSLRLDSESLRTITGLVAVVTAILAVGALTVVAINLLGGEKGKESTVAITTSAFGIVSAVVSAYLGIKATVNASDKAIAALDPDKKNGSENKPPHPQEGAEEK